MRQNIDFVITWVNGRDRAWRRRRSQYASLQDKNNTVIDNDECRYRDWGLLRYWFRGIEKFAPWHGTVHFITEGHLPPWLNTENPRLHIVKHSDYIPAGFLPTFNSCVIEMWMHRIKGLSRQFVYFNDDFFLTRPVSPKDFFIKGKPRDMAAFQPVVANPQNPVMSHRYLNNMLVLCKYFDKRKLVTKHPGHYFHIGYPPLYFFYNLLEMAFPLYTGLYTVHGPSPFLKSTFEELWRAEGSLLERVSANRFRSDTDISIYLFREWQKLSGNFRPGNVQKNLGYYEIRNDNKKLLSAIYRQKKKITCINDTLADASRERRIRLELQKAFRHILPEESSFERRFHS